MATERSRMTAAGCWMLLLLLLMVLLLSQRASGQAKTDPSEVAALNTILGRWGKPASKNWNISGEPCSGWAIDTAQIDNNGDFNPGIKCNCQYNNSTTCHIYKLKVYALDVVGPIPNELRNLTYLTNINFAQNYLTGPIPAFIGELTKMQYLSLGINALSGPIPKELGQLTQLVSLGLGSNNFNGSIPEEFGNFTKLEQLYIDSSGLSGKLPQTLSKLKNMKILWASDNDFSGQIPDYIGSWINMTELRLQGNSFQGPIPSSISNLVKLDTLRIGDIVNGSSSLAFISNLTSLSNLVLRNAKISDTLPNFAQFKKLQLLDLSFNNITGQLPGSLLSLSSLQFLFLGNNSLSGSLPNQLSSSLSSIDLSYNQLSGIFPSWASNQNLQLNLVKNNFIVSGANESILPSGFNCLQNNIPCYLNSPKYSSFAVNCGGSKSITGSDRTAYDIDNANLGAASFFVNSQTKWGVSNVGLFLGSSNASYIIGSLSQFQNTLDTELFQDARMSPSSLRYYGFGLENGNYTVNLQFAEIAFPDPPTWESVGRRVFDVYIQGELQLKDFDIRKEAGGKSFYAVTKRIFALVTANFLEIHFFWAGKGTCCIPTQGYYGPAISAISVTPNFTPQVPIDNGENGKKSSETGLIVGIVVGVAGLGLFAAGIFFCIARKRQRDLEEKELLSIVGRPDLFSFAGLKAATGNFSASNVLGEGGYGPVYKGKLPDGRIIAVKQLSEASRQGKSQFLTEIATISAVQHRNLVKLYGCCIEGKNPLLVYEYLPNGSLDKALYGKNNLKLDWRTRYDICIGIARGLAYLHEESSPRIIHRDIKSSNILLDADLSPKISDFGLAKLYDEKHTHVNTSAAGTHGYLAPEYAMRGHLSEKVDAFAFGVVLLEIVSGRPISDDTFAANKTYLLEWAWRAFLEKNALEIMDPNLKEYDADEALRVISIGLLCTQGPPHQRPAMSVAVSMLRGEVEVATVTVMPSYLLEFQLNYMGVTEDFNSRTELYTSTSSTGGRTGGAATTMTSSASMAAEALSEGR